MDHRKEFNVEEVSGGVQLSPAKPFLATDINNVVGCLKYNGKPKTIEEMDNPRNAASPWN